MSAIYVIVIVHVGMRDRSMSPPGVSTRWNVDDARLAIQPGTQSLFTRLALYCSSSCKVDYVD
jgi:hypothetical protein